MIKTYKFFFAIKVIISLITVYVGLFTPITNTSIPFFLEFLFLCLDLVILILWLNRLQYWKYLIFLVGFYIWAFVTGCLFSINRLGFFSYIFIGIEYFLFLYAGFLIEKKYNDDYVIKLLFLLCIAYMLTCVIGNKRIYGRLVINYTSNANDLGNICFVYAICLIYVIKKWKWKFLIVPFYVFNLYVSIQSGSRKSFLVVLFIPVFYFLLRLNYYKKKYSLKLFFSFFIVIIALFFLAMPIINYYSRTLLFDRFTNSSELNYGRISLYKDGIKCFFDNPMFGVGFRCYQHYKGNSSGLYAHSAFIEVLAGTGGIGFFLWILGYSKPLIQSLLVYSKNRSFSIYAWIVVFLTFQFVLDFASTTLYMPINMLLLGTAYGKLYFYKEQKIESSLEDMKI